MLLLVVWLVLPVAGGLHLLALMVRLDRMEVISSRATSPLMWHLITVIDLLWWSLLIRCLWLELIRGRLLFIFIILLLRLQALQLFFEFYRFDLLLQVLNVQILLIDGSLVDFWTSRRARRLWSRLSLSCLISLRFLVFIDVLHILLFLLLLL